MERLSGSQRRELQKGLRLRSKFSDAVELNLRHPGEFRVRSETGNGYYHVARVEDRWTCECEAFREQQDNCKHVWAAISPTLDRAELGAAAGGPLPTYTQDWPAYDAAQQDEYVLFDPLLWSLLDDIPEPPRPPGKRGRNPIPLRDQLFVGIRKVYSGWSGKRARGILRKESAGGHGLLARVPNYAVPSRVFNREDTGPILLDLITRSALPLKEIEDAGTVSIDSTGFCTNCIGAYCTEMHNPTRKHRFVKAHLAVGVKTHVVLGVRITDEVGADSSQFVPLLKSVIEAGFTPANVVADAAYPSRVNYEAAAELGMNAFLAFKSNATRKTKHITTKAGPLGKEVYRRMLLYFQLHRDAFDRKYHLRSNSESTNWAIKRKIGELLSSKNPTARVNELIAKILAYNLTVLVHEIHEHGIDPASINLPPPPKPKPAAQAAAPESAEVRESVLADLGAELYRLSRTPTEPCDSIPDPVTNFDGREPRS